MNVLFVLRSFPSCGGVQSITKIIAESLLDRGLNVTVYIWLYWKYFSPALF